MSGSNIILGSGLIGKIAKDIFPDYRFVPFGKSRFYGWNCPLAEDYISVHESAHEYVDRFKSDFRLIGLETREYKRPFSVSGQLIYSSNIPNLTSNPYLLKVYGQSPELLQKLVSNTMFGVYNDVTPSFIFNKLNFDEEISADFGEFGKLVHVDLENHILRTEKRTIEYKHIISTIPLDALTKFSGVDGELESRDVFFYLIRTNSLDLEGADQVLVVENDIDFYSVSELGPSGLYLFKSFRELSDGYLKMFLSKYEVVQKTVVKNYIPIGDVDKSIFESNDVDLVGSLARWDDFFDVGACINKLMKSS